MPAILPKSTLLKRNIRHILRPVRAPRALIQSYFKEIASIMDDITDAMNDIAWGPENLENIKKTLDVADDVISMIQRRAQVIGETNTKRAADYTNRAFEQALIDSFSIPFATIFNSGETNAIIADMVTANVGLIEKIPKTYFSKIIDAVQKNVKGTLDMSLRERIIQLGADSKNHAQLVARDQMSKIVGNIGQLQQKEVGIVAYIWKTTERITVVGTPGGLYPKGNPKHMNHYIRNNKIFYYANPPPDGHPSQAIQCMCYPKPIINTADLKAVFV